MSAGPPPPPPVKLPDTSLRLAELDPCFKEQAQLERQLSKLHGHHLSAHERAHIPTDFPDLLTLSSMTHVLALVGPFARYDAGEIAAIKVLVKDQLAGKVTAFKAIGDQVNLRKDLYKQKKPQDMEETRRMVQQMKELFAEIEELVKRVMETALRLREEKKGFRPESLPSVERKTYPPGGAEWFISPVKAYVEEERQLGGGERSIKGFVRWCRAQTLPDGDEMCRRLVMRMVIQMGAFREESGLMNAKLVEARVKEYIKYFKSSLPPDCILK